MARVWSIDPGERDRLVTIQQAATADAGFPTETWTALVDAWMGKQQISGRERFAAAQVSAPFDTRWEMAYRADMDPELVDVPKARRLVYQGRVHDIVSADLIGRRDGVELLTLSGGTAQ